MEKDFIGFSRGQVDNKLTSRRLRSIIDPSENIHDKFSFFFQNFYKKKVQINLLAKLIHQLILFTVSNKGIFKFTNNF